MDAANKKGKEIRTIDIRMYFSKLMNRVYNSTSLSPSDIEGLTMLSMGLDRFLKDTEKSDNASKVLYSELEQIAGREDGSDDTREMGNDEPKLIIENQKLITENGKYFYVGSKIGSGGEGTVYKIPGMPGKVVKIFRPNVDKNKKERRMLAYSHNKIPSRIDGTLIAAIPEERVYTEDAKFIGFIMPMLSSPFKLQDVLRNTPDRRKYFPELDYKGMIGIAYNLAEIVDIFHNCNVLVGDMNFNNIVVNTDGTVCLIDADSFDITDTVTNERFPCSVGLSELLPPELQQGALAGRFSKEADEFSLAVIIFRLLMNNADPFGSAGQEFSAFGNMLSCSMITTSDLIYNGECTYNKKTEGQMIPSWAPPLEILPFNIQELFVRVFDYDSTNFWDRINKRPSAKEWMSALMEYYQMPMNHCGKNGFHWYRKDLKKCPFCSCETGVPTLTVGL